MLVHIQDGTIKTMFSWQQIPLILFPIILFSSYRWKWEYFGGLWRVMYPGRSWREAGILLKRRNLLAFLLPLLHIGSPVSLLFIIKWHHLGVQKVTEPPGLPGLPGNNLSWLFLAITCQTWSCKLEIPGWEPNPAFHLQPAPSAHRAGMAQAKSQEMTEDCNDKQK